MSEPADHEDAYRRAVAILAEESDRGRVVVACSFIDDVLRRILLAHFLKGSTAKDLVDGHDGPLGAYADRARTAYVLGLISKAELQDVLALGDLRNIFAHQAEVGYDQPEVRAFAPRLLRAAGADRTDAAVAPDRVVYDACAALMARLADRPERVPRARPAETAELPEPKRSTES